MTLPDPLPPATPGGIAAFLRRIFQDVPTSIASIVAITIILAFFVPFLRWGVFDADFLGSEPDDCRFAGACWPFIRAKFGELIYGYYPVALRFQVNVSVVALLIGGYAAYRLAGRYQVVPAIVVYVASMVLSFWLFSGSVPGFTPVPVEKWGGLSITLLLFGIGMGVSFIFGGLLALGRRSKLVFVRSVSSIYVEFMRGVPLIAILFIAVVMFPIFLPGGAEMNMFLRVLAGICLYTSSYMAEAIRAGLESVPESHLEAAEALGLSRWTTLKFIVFPQSLTISMPGLVNTMIALVKDTSLVIIVGLHDFMGVIQLSLSDVAWGNVQRESYIFAGLMYFAICYVVSSFGAMLERRSHRSRAAHRGGD